MRRRGFTLVEVLVALAILVVILGLATRYFTENAELARETQARSELQDRVRMVMQVVSGDLQMAGARYWSQGAENIGFSLPANSVLTGTNNAAKDSLIVSYVTSLRDRSQACRLVSYSFQGDTLLRSDVNITPGSGRDCLPTDPAFQPLADGIAALDIVYLCSNGQREVIPENCGSESDVYPRSAIVEVVGYSLSPMKAAGPQTITTVSGESVTCPAGRGCYALRQEVLMPNLKPLPE